MKIFYFEIKWPPIKSSVIKILIIVTLCSISIDGQSINCKDYFLKPGENKTIFEEANKCIVLVCDQSNIIWKKNQDRVIIGMFHSMLYMKEYSLV